MKIKILYIFSFMIIQYIHLYAQSTPFKVVGYYSIVAALKNEDPIPFKYLTHINLWFLNPDTSGYFNQDLSALKSFISRAHRKNIKVLFSIGGGSKQSQYHQLLQDRRPRLIQNLISITNQYHLDGIDVDLEGSDIDQNYQTFAIELAQTLHAQQKILTAAVAVYYKNQLTDSALQAYDFVNIMSYDRTGPWRPDRPGPHSTFTHAVEDLRYFGVERKISKGKMTLGVPFYGYGYGPDLTSMAISMSYDKIIKAYPGASQVDEWLLPDGKIMYYNGANTIKQKTMVAHELASGIMIWQIMGDAKGNKSLLKTIHSARQ